MNYPAAELRSIKMDFCPINPDAEHRGILLIKCVHFNYKGAPLYMDAPFFSRFTILLYFYAFE
jgi:hypothetical protein